MTKVREFATRWHRPDDRMFFERDKEKLIGSAHDHPLNTPKFRPFDMLSQPNQALVLWQNDDMRIGVESVAGVQDAFRRGCDYDELLFQFAGKATVETEYGVFELGPSELLHIPAGVAHRSTSEESSFRVFARVVEPLTWLLGEDNLVSKTEFDMVREGGPNWPTPHLNGAPSGGVVLEKLTRWNDAPGAEIVIDRPYEYLVGVATAGRGVRKVRAFDFFTSMTGKGGPGPMIMESSVFQAEVYNTEGDQFAFHRGLDNDELWIQFSGDSINESEFGMYHLGPAEMNHIPPGFAHRVVGGRGFLRLVLYSRKPWQLMVDPTKHAFESTFTPRERAIVRAAWKDEAAAPVPAR